MNIGSNPITSTKTKTMKKENTTDYIPYGEEWEKEISKLSKSQIIEMFASIGKEKIRLEKVIKEQNLAFGFFEQ